MKRIATLMVTAAAIWGGAELLAAEPKAGEDLARKNVCTACHSAEQKLVGPAFKEIAAKYKGQNNAAAMLSEKVKKGSTGAWGSIPMPPNGHVPDEDIKAIVEWILTI
jgi:cytochrome c